MKYLFFDIECAKCENGGKGYICEFGYVITDEKFQIIETDNYVINPACKFDRFALKNILHHTKQEYLACPTFPIFYDRISALLDDKRYTIVGHSTATDFGYLKFECGRYELSHLNFQYYDIRDSFKYFRQEKDNTGLDKMFGKLEITQPDNLHEAQGDAMATMLIFKELCSRYKKTPQEILKVTLPQSAKTCARKTNKSPQ